MHFSTQLGLIETEMTAKAWSVDFGDGQGPKFVDLPHTWRQDVPVSWEGPATYSCNLEVPSEGGSLVFHGVSYAAEISVDGELVLTHKGIWDAFSVPLHAYAGRAVELKVVVVKNGGNSYPVRKVLSGFLPYVFQTFGGIFREVEFVPGPSVSLDKGPAQSRIALNGSNLFLDGEPFFMRGVLHWGWYPEIGAPNPGEQQIASEIAGVQAMGFNTVKFCLWLPPHRYLDLLDEAGMTAWIELPLWNPDLEDEEAIEAEVVRIVRQYRHHSAIIAWTIGCELGNSVSARLRERLTNLVKSLTGCPLVTDNSGGAEMYGGDPREFGDFADFHPYCDLPFYPAVLDSLVSGPRRQKIVLLGEFNDHDHHRDLHHLEEEQPYWASALPEFNAQGVRWQYDLPRVLAASDYAHAPRDSDHEALMRSSISKGAFIRRKVGEYVRSRSGLSGYVITGLRDTPISTSGMFDDWGEKRYSDQEVLAWNGPSSLFLIPRRLPKWSNGGNRAGWADSQNVWTGPTIWHIGCHSEVGQLAGGIWRIEQDGQSIATGLIEPIKVAALMPEQVAEIYFEVSNPGAYELTVEFGSLRQTWPILVVSREHAEGRVYRDAPGDFEKFVTAPDLASAQVAILTRDGTIPKPFWRECAFRYSGRAFWDQTPFQDRWERLLPISSDRVLDLDWARSHSVGEPEFLMHRVDTRTYHEDPLIVRLATGTIVTTLRPQGGLGAQPPGLAENPAGHFFLNSLMQSFK